MMLATLAFLATTTAAIAAGSPPHAQPNNTQRIIPAWSPQSNLPAQQPEFRFATPPDQLRTVEPLHNHIGTPEPRYYVDTPNGTSACTRSANTIICP